MMCLCKMFGIAFLLLTSGTLLAQDAEAPAAAPSGSAAVDLEQVDDNWENSAPTQPVNPQRNIKIKDIIEPTAEYTYASFGKADPFEPPKQAPKPKVSENKAIAKVIKGSQIKVSSPLQSYPLNALKIKGVWQLATGDLRAIITTPKNEGVIIKVGDPISSGKVLKVQKDMVVARLYRLRKDGVREYEDTEIGFGIPNRVLSGVIKLAPGEKPEFPSDKAGRTGLEMQPAEPASSEGLPSITPPSSEAAPLGGAGAVAPPTVPPLGGAGAEVPPTVPTGDGVSGNGTLAVP